MLQKIALCYPPAIKSFALVLTVLLCAMSIIGRCWRRIWQMKAATVRWFFRTDSLRGIYFTYLMKKKLASENLFMPPNELKRLCLNICIVIAQFTEIEFALPADDSSYKLLNNRRAAFIEPCMMVRIADVRKFLTGLEYAVNNISLKIKVNDLLMENNNNIFSLTVTEGAGQINLGADWDVALDIGELSAIILGAEDTEALRRQGKIEVKSEEAFQNLKRLWPKENNYINEEY